MGGRPGSCRLETDEDFAAVVESDSDETLFVTAVLRTMGLFNLPLVFLGLVVKLIRLSQSASSGAARDDARELLAGDPVWEDVADRDDKRPVKERGNPELDVQNGSSAGGTDVCEPSATDDAAEPDGERTLESSASVDTASLARATPVITPRIFSG